MVAIVLCVAGERLYDGVVNIDDDNEDDVDDGVDDSDDVGEMLTEKEKKNEKTYHSYINFFLSVHEYRLMQ